MAVVTISELAEFYRPAGGGDLRPVVLIEQLRKIRNQTTLLILDDVYRIAQPALDHIMLLDKLPDSGFLVGVVMEARERLMLGFTELVEKGVK